MSKVEVRPIDTVNKWHGKKGKESFTQPKVVEVLYDESLGRFATGLSTEEAKQYGELMGVDLSDTFNPNEPHPFWSTKPASIKLENHTMIFDTERASDFVKVKNMKASKLVANSMKEWNEGKWPEATHYIHDETEDVKERAGKIQLRNKAVGTLDKMTADDKIALIQVILGKSLKGRSNDFIDVEMDDVLENHLEEFVKYVKMGNEEIHLRASILELVMKNILTREGQAISYMNTLLGLDMESTIDWFKKPENSKIRVSILEKLDKTI